MSLLEDLSSRADAHIMRTYGPPKGAFVRGKGTVLFDGNSTPDSAQLINNITSVQKDTGRVLTYQTAVFVVFLCGEGPGFPTMDPTWRQA